MRRPSFVSGKCLLVALTITTAAASSSSQAQCPAASELPERLRELSVDDLRQIQQLASDIEDIQWAGFLDEHGAPLTDHDGAPLERSSATEATRIELARLLAAAIERDGRDRVIELLERREHRELLGLADAIATTGDAITGSITRADARLLLLAGEISFEISAELEDATADPSEALIVSALRRHAERQRAIARLRRLAVAPDRILAAALGDVADRVTRVRGWARRLAALEPETGTLDHRDATDTAHARRVLTALRARRDALTSGSWYLLADEVQAGTGDWLATMQVPARLAGCVLSLIARRRELREVPLGPPGTPNALRLIARLAAPMTVDSPGLERPVSADLYLSAPIGPVGIRLAGDATTAAVDAVRSWDVGVRMRDLRVEITSETAEGLSVALRTRSRGIATSISTDARRASTAIFDREAAHDCLLPLPDGIVPAVIGATADIEHGTLVMQMTLQPWFPPSDPMEIVLESGVTTTEQLREDVERQILDRVRTWIEAGAAATARDMGATALAVESVHVHDGHIRARLSMSVSWLDVPMESTVDIASAPRRLAVIEHRVPVEVLPRVRQALRDAVRSFDGAGVDPWIAAYIDVADVQVVHDGGRIQGVQGRLLAGNAVPASIRTALAGAHFRWSGGAVELVWSTTAAQRALEDAVRSELPGAIARAAPRIPELREGLRIDLFGGTATVTHVRDLAFDVDMAWDAVHVGLNGLQWQDGRVDLSEVSITSAGASALLERVRGLLASDVLILSAPEFASSHLRVDAALHIPDLGSDFYVGTIEIGADGFRMNMAFARSVNEMVRGAVSRWLEALPEEVLVIEDVATLSRPRLEGELRIVGGPARLALAATVRLADTVNVNVVVRLAPEFSVTMSGDPVTVLMSALGDLGAAFLRDALRPLGASLAVQILPAGGRGPIGLLLRDVTIPVLADQLCISLGNIEITTAGVTLPTRFGLRIPVDIPLGATGLVLSRPGIEVDVQAGSLSALGDIAVANAAFANLIRIDAEVSASWSALTIDVRGTTYVLRVLPLSQVTGQIDLRQATAYLEQGTTGLVSRIFQLRNRLDINGTEGTYSSRASVDVFGLSIYEAGLLIDVLPMAEASVQGTFRLDLPLVSANADLRASLNLSDVHIGAGAALSVGEWDIASAEFDIDATRARVEFRLLGLELSVSVPSPLGLTPQVILDVILSLFRPDFENFFENLVRGRVEINLGATGHGEEDTEADGRPIGEGDPIPSSHPPAARTAEEDAEGRAEAAPLGGGPPPGAGIAPATRGGSAGSGHRAPVAVPAVVTAPGAPVESMFIGGEGQQCRLAISADSAPDSPLVEVEKWCLEESEWTYYGTFGVTTRSVAERACNPANRVWIDWEWVLYRFNWSHHARGHVYSNSDALACPNGEPLDFGQIDVHTLTIITPASEIIVADFVFSTETDEVFQRWDDPEMMQVLGGSEWNEDTYLDRSGSQYWCPDGPQCRCRLDLLANTPLVVPTGALPPFMSEALEGRTAYDAINSGVRAPAYSERIAWHIAVRALTRSRAMPQIYVLPAAPARLGLERPQIQVVHYHDTGDVVVVSAEQDYRIEPNSALARELDVERLVSNAATGVVDDDHDLFLRTIFGAADVWSVIDVSHGAVGFEAVFAEEREDGGRRVTRLVSQRGGELGSVLYVAAPFNVVVPGTMDGETIDVVSVPGMPVLRRAIQLAGRADTRFTDGIALSPASPSGPEPVTVVPRLYPFFHSREARAVYWSHREVTLLVDDRHEPIGIASTRAAVARRLGWLVCGGAEGSGLIEDRRLRATLTTDPARTCLSSAPSLPITAQVEYEVSRLLAISDDSWRDRLVVNPLVLLTPIAAGAL